MRGNLRTWPILLTALVLAAVALLSQLPQQSGAQAIDSYTVRLQSRQFTPDPVFDLDGIRAARAGAPEDSVHFLIQFYSLPDASERQWLSAQGFNLLNYLSGNAYIVSSTVSDLDGLPAAGNLRWAGPLVPTDKLGPNLEAGDIGSWARWDDGRAVFTVQVHPDVSVAEAEAVVTRVGGTVIDSAPLVPSVSAAFDPTQVEQIASEDEVQFVEVVSPPIAPQNPANPAVNDVAGPSSPETATTVSSPDAGTTGCACPCNR